MPNANWSNPTLTSTYTNFVSEVKNRDEDLALQFDGTTSTNIPTDAIRWDSSANRWKKWNGSSWVELTSTYALTALTTTGSVGIGTSSPNEKLDVSSGTSGTAAVVKIQDPGGRVVQIASPSASTEAYIGTTTNHRLDFYTNNGVKATLDQLGRLLVGTSAARSINGVQHVLQIEGTTLPGSSLSVMNNTNDQNPPYLTFGKSKGGSLNSVAAVAADTGLGAIAFMGADGTSLLESATIKCFVDGTPGTNDLPTRLVFSTTADGSSSPTERVRLDSAGRLGIGTSSPGSLFHANGFSTTVNPVALGSNANAFSLTAGANAFGLTAGVLGSGAAYLQSGTTSGTGIAYSILLNPNGGNVGIGTSSPGHRLDVAGGVNSTGLNVTGTGGFFNGANKFGVDNNGGVTRMYSSGPDASTRGSYDFRTTDSVGTLDTSRMVITSAGNVGIGTSSPTALLHVNGDAQVNSLNGGPLAGFRNRIINGGMVVDQRNNGASQTFTAAAALAYSVDRWYGYCTGANVTGQQVAGATAGQFRYRFTGTASVTAIGFGQRIEQLNSADLAGSTATLSVDLANSVLTTVTWTAFYATTADSFGTLASPTRTQIATGTFTVNSTVTRYNTNISIPAAATTGIEIVFTVGAQTSGTWTIGNVQLEAGSVSTPYERRSYGQELALCQRYYYKNSASGAEHVTINGYTGFLFKQTMRTSPTCTVGVGSISGTVPDGLQVLHNNNVSCPITATAEL